MRDNVTPRDVQETLLRRMSQLFTTAGSLWLAVELSFMPISSWPSTAVAALCWLAFPAAWFASSRGMPHAPARLMVAGLWGFGTIGLLKAAFVPAPILAYCLSVMVMSLTAGRRGAAFSVVATFGGTLLAGALVSQGVVTVVFVGIDRAALMDFGIWARVATVVVFFATLLAISVRYVVRSLARALDATHAALDSLRREEKARVGAETDLATAHSTLERVRQFDLVGRLAGSVAHDFNNALVVILGSADMLDSDRFSPAAKAQALSAIRTSAAQTAQLTRQLMHFGKQDLGQVQLVALDAELAAFHDSFTRLLPEDVELSVDANSGARLRLDPSRLQHGLLNLALNACDAMPQGGRLQIRAELDSEDLGPGGRPWVVVSIEDDGVGMGERTQARIFEPFFTTKGVQGTGLGLATIEDFVRESGGTIEVRSLVGEGTRFDIRLPTSESKPVEVDLPSLPTDTDFQGLSVLVAEDDDEVRAVMTSAFEGAGFQVFAARDAEEALRLARRVRRPISLLCTDAVMPGPLSIQGLIDRFREIHPQGKVLVCSGHVPEELLRQNLRAGEYPFLAKPFSQQALLHKVARVLASSRSASEAPP